METVAVKDMAAVDMVAAEEADTVAEEWEEADTVAADMVVVDTDKAAEVMAEVELDMVQRSLVVATVETQRMAIHRHAWRAACPHRDNTELQRQTFPPSWLSSDSQAKRPSNTVSRDMAVAAVVLHRRTVVLHRRTVELHRRTVVERRCRKRSIRRR